MDKKTLIRLLEPFTDSNKAEKNSKMITKVDFFFCGLTGCEGASEKRAILCRECGLPDDMTPNALLEAMNLLYGYDEFTKLVDGLFK